MFKFYFYCTPFCQCVPMETSITRPFSTFQIVNIIAYSTKFFLILRAYISNNLKLLYAIFFCPNSTIIYKENMESGILQKYITKQ